MFRRTLIVASLVSMIVVLTFGPAVAGKQKVLFVPTDYPSIQQAIEASRNGFEIIVDPGVYYENIDYKGKNITIRSVDPLDPAIVESTIIDGGGSGHVVFFSEGASEAAIISGFTIRNGFASTNGGGGILCYSPATITNCVITGNSSTSDGGGIGAYNLGITTVQDSIISENSAEYSGGGVYTRAEMIVKNCDISDNSANSGLLSYTGGGGIYVADSQAVLTITDSTINNNVHGGLRIRLAPANISHCTISGNTGNGIILDQSPSTIANCVITGNTADAYGIEPHGGGIWIASTPFPPVITGSIISGNTALDNGGGIYGSSVPTITNSLIINNVAGGAGGAIYTQGGPLILNSTLSNNIAGTEGGGIYNYNGTMVATNSIFWGNTANGVPNQIYAIQTTADISFSDIEGGWSGNGNIDAPPFFVAPFNDDFHLLYGSPCIDSGTDLTSQGVIDDLEGTLRPQGEFYDMGAFEYAPDCVPEPEICNDGIDNDCDGLTDTADLLDCPVIVCSSYPDKNSCNNEPSCRWNNKNKVCVDR